MDIAQELARRLVKERPELKDRHYAILVSTEDGDEVGRAPYVFGCNFQSGLDDVCIATSTAVSDLAKFLTVQAVRRVCRPQQPGSLLLLLLNKSLAKLLGYR
jgi:hypothetical protein